jgi:hypothetical protein
VASSHNWSSHARGHDASNLRRHPIILVRGKEIELIIPDVGAIHHAEFVGRERVAICTIMRSVLSKSLSAEVYDHTDLQHLISSAEVDLNPLAQLSQAAKSGRTRKIKSVIPNVAAARMVRSKRMAPALPLRNQPTTPASSAKFPMLCARRVTR